MEAVIDERMEILIYLLGTPFTGERTVYHFITSS